MRPDRFRFQFTDTGLRRALVRVHRVDGRRRSALLVGRQAGRPQRRNVQDGLRIAAGVSGGSSVRIPGLLLPRSVGEGPSIIAAERIQDGSDRGVPCFRIRGKSQKTPYTLTMGAQVLTVQDESITLWIDRATLLLRKFEDKKTFDTYNSESITTYMPEIDVEIPPEQLTFNAPQPP